MNQLSVLVGLAVGVITLVGLGWRAVAGIFRLVLAGQQLGTAVEANTAATRDLSGRLTQYQDATDARLEALEHRRFL